VLSQNKAYEDIEIKKYLFNRAALDENIIVSENINLERVYIYKHINEKERILGVNI
jgi:hypothetical protein